jgi:hypothetical protein
MPHIDHDGDYDGDRQLPPYSDAEIRALMEGKPTGESSAAKKKKAEIEATDEEKLSRSLLSEHKSSVQSLAAEQIATKTCKVTHHLKEDGILREFAFEYAFLGNDVPLEYCMTDAAARFEKRGRSVIVVSWDSIKNHTNFAVNSKRPTCMWLMDKAIDHYKSQGVVDFSTGGCFESCTMELGGQHRHLFA